MGYRWPIRPFDRQHPVRAFLNDPRIEGSSRAFHFGIDISAPDGTAVHAVQPGRVSKVDPTAIAVVRDDRRTFGYWHIDPVVASGARVRVGTLLGHIAPGWGHVHFAESARPGGTAYVNPLRRGGITPFEKHTHPTITAVGFRHGSTVVSAGNVNGLVNVLVDVFDTTPLPVPPPWHGMPVMPSALRWRVLDGDRVAVRWRAGVNLRPWRKASAFHLLFAPSTRQNHPDQPGLFRIIVAHEWPSGSLRDGDYTIQVEAVDVRGNLARSGFPFTIANHGPPV